MSLKPKDIVLHYPVQVKNLNLNSYFFYILYYQSNMPYNLTSKTLVTLIKLLIFICKEGIETVGQPNSW